MSQPTTREELYERIRTSSKTEVILEEMIRLGFWPAQGQMPQDPTAELRRQEELQRQLNALRTESQRLNNEHALIAETRKRRLVEAKRKRQETKDRHERERKERAARWAERRSKEITYLGEGVSGGLSDAAADAPRLAASGLPVLATAGDLAGAMGISVGELRFLTFSRSTSEVSHYQRFLLPKKTGGMRLIAAPMPRLKAAQAWVLTNILEKVAVHEVAHGFTTGRSIVSNARPHVGAAIVINLDLKDFFPSVSYRRVKGVFRRLGYSDVVATLLGLLCTQPDVEEVTLDGKSYFVGRGARHLPQGSPASPALTNLLCRRLDRRLQGLALKLGFVYTRYADDLTFSWDGAHERTHDNVCNVLKGVADIVTHEGFVVHPDKTRVMRKGRLQEVTGVVVNEKLGVPRKELRRFRATLFQIERDGPTGKQWGKGPDLMASIQGYASFVAMVDPEKGAALVEQVKRILTKTGYRPPRYEKRPEKPLVAKGASPAADPQGAESADEQPGAAVEGGSEPVVSGETGEAEGAAKKPWWKFW